MKLIPDSHYFKFPFHRFIVVKQVHCPQHSRKTFLCALYFRLHQIRNPKRNEVQVILVDVAACPQKMVDEYVGVGQHQGRESGIYFRRDCSCLCESTNT